MNDETIVITIKPEGAEYEDGGRHDRVIAGWLEELARRIRKNGLDNVTKVLDGNGNSVGTVD